MLLAVQRVSRHQELNGKNNTSLVFQSPEASVTRKEIRTSPVRTEEVVTSRSTRCQVTNDQTTPRWNLTQSDSKTSVSKVIVQHSIVEAAGWLTPLPWLLQLSGTTVLWIIWDNSQPQQRHIPMLLHLSLEEGLKINGQIF